MNSARIDVVQQAFKILDEDRRGSIPLGVLIKKYNPTGHPRVKTREKSPDQVFKDFEFAITKKAYNAFLYVGVEMQ